MDVPVIRTRHTAKNRTLMIICAHFACVNRYKYAYARIIAIVTIIGPPSLRHLHQPPFKSGPNSVQFTALVISNLRLPINDGTRLMVAPLKLHNT